MNQQSQAWPCLAIITRRHVDQFPLLECEVIEKARRPNIVHPDALLDGNEDVDRDLADGIIGAWREVFRHVVDRAGLSAASLHFPGAGAEHDQAAMAVKR